ncbi:MAG: alpha/beta hydrolase [Acidimicrobiales bacterium]|nr:alpha/beta hydrolase [Acidimicrobiales bacterium]
MLHPRILLSAAGTAGVLGMTAWTARHLSSPAVRTWEPPTLAGRRWGRLWARSGGDGATAIMLLHGLVSTGDIFGAGFDRLAERHRVVVPDLLGFGRSLDEARTAFSVEAHLDALDELAESTGALSADRVMVGAHSMGSSLALRWAARHPDRVVRVVCWGAPVYPSQSAARTRISGSTMARLFVLDTDLAKRACALSCRHRRAAGWLTVAAEPRLPIPVARAVPLHTWPAYRDAMRHLVIDTDWTRLLARLDHGPTQLRLVWGERDPVGDRHHVARLLHAHPDVEMTVVAGADHQLPTTDPGSCIDQLTSGDRPVD